MTERNGFCCDTLSCTITIISHLLFIWHFCSNCSIKLRLRECVYNVQNLWGTWAKKWYRQKACILYAAGKESKSSPDIVQAAVDPRHIFHVSQWSILVHVVYCPLFSNIASERKFVFIPQFDTGLFFFTTRCYNAVNRTSSLFSFQRKLVTVVWVAVGQKYVWWALWLTHCNKALWILT